jgi:hypothetical protein
MQITPDLLKQATEQGLLHPGQGSALWAFLESRQGDTPSFKPAHILYYLGGLTAIGAMTLFMTLGWERLGGGGLLLIASSYIVIVVAAVEFLLRRKRLVLPAGILSALAVALVPLAVYGLQRWLGWWPDAGMRNGAYRDFHFWIDWRWLMMELATLAAGAIALWRWKLPFGVMPLAVTLWYLSMDIVPLLLGGAPGAFFSDEGKRVSTAFGLAMTALAFWVDVRSTRRRGEGRGDFAFWLCIFGVLAFWGGLTSMDSNSELGKFIYACINLLLIATGAMLQRRVFAVFGGLGVALYLGQLSHTVFKDSLLFPVALCAIGLGVMGAGVLWQRHESAIGERLRAALPRVLRALVEHRGAE